ncbi:MAG: hypothetical protein VYB65_14385 [Myxococcota bacterium]|nr:hypothetical protein [Myxococcota bacterium]
MRFLMELTPEPALEPFKPALQNRRQRLILKPLDGEEQQLRPEVKKQSAAPERSVIVALHPSPEEPERQIVNGAMKSRTSGPRDITNERHTGGEYLSQRDVVEVGQS